ncbi:hypothetical protein BF93_08605 [Brachybacterium phenoliresistens]|uniref:Uncharacterized protein n=1 Tax=Brachybacterium phenoliresistens TaxID=396014 RepID=Z9JQI2_9MICO|nr:hypothetical protein BF93_08605 [Brachybacterium phenoliresistens]
MRRKLFPSKADDQLQRIFDVSHLEVEMDWVLLEVRLLHTLQDQRCPDGDGADGQVVAVAAR